MKIDTSKKYQTRQGNPVTLFTTESPDKKYPVVGTITHPTGETVNFSWTRNGCAHHLANSLAHDLVEVPEVPELREVWVNHYPSGSCLPYETKESAIRHASNNVSEVAVRYVEVPDGYHVVPITAETPEPTPAPEPAYRHFRGTKSKWRVAPDGTVECSSIGGNNWHRSFLDLEFLVEHKTEIK